MLALKPEKYINSGLLVMNCAAFRRKHFSRHFFDLLANYHFDCIAPDQDYLNEMGEGQIFYLPPRWNAMPNENTLEIKNPGIIHYNLFSSCGTSAKFNMKNTFGKMHGKQSFIYL